MSDGFLPADSQPYGGSVRVPKYYQVRTQILALIEGLPPGAAVPTERELAARFDTSRTTVRRAIAELVVDGRLRRTQGSGTFVAQPKLMMVRPLTSFSQDLTAEGWRPGALVLSLSEVAAEGEAADRLQLAPGAPIHRIERLRTAAGETIAHEVAMVPGPLPGLDGELTARGSLYLTLAQVYGRMIDAVEDVVETTTADPVTAGLLKVETGLPLLLVHRTGWDSGGRPVEWTRSLFRGDRFRFVARQRLTDTAHPGASAPR